MTEPLASATYVYCVVESARPPALGRARKKLPGAGAPRTLALGGTLHAVVASAPLALYAAEAIEAKLRDLDWVSACAAAHEAVIERAGEAGTVVPMKLFTLFSSDERAVRSLARRRRALERAAERIAGCDEWGLRVLLESAAKDGAPKPQAKLSGTGFLQRKREQRTAERERADRAAEDVDALFAALEPLSRGAVRRPAVSRELEERVLLDAAFLVPRAAVKRFTAAVSKSARGLAREGCHVALSGPWPAYSFVGGR